MDSLVSLGACFAEGRGKVEMLETKLILDPATSLSSNTVVEIVTANPVINTRNLTETVREKIPSHNQEHASKAIATARRLGLVHTVNGRNNAKLFHLGPDLLGKRSRDGSLSTPEYGSATSQAKCESCERPGAKHGRIDNAFHPVPASVMLPYCTVGSLHSPNTRGGTPERLEKEAAGFGLRYLDVSTGMTPSPQHRVLRD